MPSTLSTLGGLVLPDMGGCRQGVLHRLNYAFVNFSSLFCALVPFYAVLILILVTILFVRPSFGCRLLRPWLSLACGWCDARQDRITEAVPTHTKGPWAASLAAGHHHQPAPGVQWSSTVSQAGLVKGG